MSAGKVVHVRVFVDRATVTRRRNVPVPAGGAGQVHTVRFGPLPHSLEVDTLRARARLGDGPLRVVSVTAQTAFAEPATERRAQVQAAVDEIDAKLRALDDAEDCDARAVALLERYAELATDRLSVEWLDPSPSFDRWTQTFDHLRTSHAQLAARRASRATDRRRLERRRRDLDAELDRLGARSAVGHEVEIALETGEGAGEAEIELSYVTRSARWMPAYDVRLTDDGRAELTAVALVRQTTREDWTDVTLVATTARPPLAEPPPELRPLAVSGYAGGPDREVVSASRAGPRLGPSSGAAPSAPATVAHEAPGPVDVPSTARPVRVELFTASLPATRRLEVAPSQRLVPMWVLELDNTSGRVLLPGTASLFSGPKYRGQADIGFVAGHQRFRLPLGTEGSLRVRRTVHTPPERRTTISGRVVHAFEAVTKLENLSGDDLQVVVWDRVPVSRVEQVTVERGPLPDGSRVDEETGRTQVALSVPAHAERAVTVSFSVVAPRGVAIGEPL